jgi:hypothetical protein
MPQWRVAQPESAPLSAQSPAAKKGAGVGAIVGGAAGTGTVLATKGKEVEFGSESRVKFTLEKDAELPVIGKTTS